MEDETLIEKLIRLGDELADAIQFHDGSRDADETVLNAIDNWRMVSDA